MTLFFAGMLEDVHYNPSDNNRGGYKLQKMNFKLERVETEDFALGFVSQSFSNNFSEIAPKDICKMVNEYLKGKYVESTIYFVINTKSSSEKDLKKSYSKYKNIFKSVEKRLVDTLIMFSDNPKFLFYSKKQKKLLNDVIGLAEHSGYTIKSE